MERKAPRRLAASRGASLSNSASSHASRCARIEVITASAGCCGERACRSVSGPASTSVLGPASTSEFGADGVTAEARARSAGPYSGLDHNVGPFF